MEFWALTFFEYNLVCEGYFAREVKQWERTRFLAWATLAPHATEGKEIELTDIMRLPTDPEPVTAAPDYFKTAEELATLVKTWEK